MLDGNRLIAMIKAAGFEAEPYSGRRMNGAQCVSFQTETKLDYGSLSKVVAQAATVQEAADVVCHVTRDTLGMGDVIYWPNVTWPDNRKGRS